MVGDGTEIGGYKKGLAWPSTRLPDNTIGHYVQHNEETA